MLGEDRDVPARDRAKRSYAFVDDLEPRGPAEREHATESRQPTSTPL